MNREIEFPGWWWGPIGTIGNLRPIARYIAEGTIDPELGAWLWLLIESGASTIVCAGPSGAGKTTLLTSLLEFVHRDRELCFVRGRFERFDPSPSANSALLINEISSHLPIYLWGPPLAIAHRLAVNGAQLMATAHADDPDELIEQFTAFPNDVPRAELAGWDLVIFLDAWVEGRTVFREIRAIHSFVPGTSSELAIDRIAIRTHRGCQLEHSVDDFNRLATRLQIDPSILDPEISHRAAVLLDPGSMRH